MREADCPPNVHGPRSSNCGSEQRGLSGREPLLPTDGAGHWFFSATGRGLKHQPFLGRPPAGLGLELHAGHGVSDLQTSNLGTS